MSEQENPETPKLDPNLPVATGVDPRNFGKETLNGPNAVEGPEFHFLSNMEALGMKVDKWQNLRLPSREEMVPREYMRAVVKSISKKCYAQDNLATLANLHGAILGEKQLEDGSKIQFESEKQRQQAASFVRHLYGEVSKKASKEDREAAPQIPSRWMEMEEKEANGFMMKFTGSAFRPKLGEKGDLVMDDRGRLAMERLPTPKWYGFMKMTLEESSTFNTWEGKCGYAATAGVGLLFRQCCGMLHDGTMTRWTTNQVEGFNALMSATVGDDQGNTAKPEEIMTDKDKAAVQDLSGGQIKLAMQELDAGQSVKITQQETTIGQPQAPISKVQAGAIKVAAARESADAEIQAANKIEQALIAEAEAKGAYMAAKAKSEAAREAAERIANAKKGVGEVATQVAQKLSRKPRATKNPTLHQRTTTVEAKQEHHIRQATAEVKNERPQRRKVGFPPPTGTPSSKENPTKTQQQSQDGK